AEIGLFKIVSESGIGAGVRRIEAITSEKAFSWMENKLHTLEDVAALLKTNEDKVISKIESVLDELKEIQKENESLQAKLSNQETEELLTKIKSIQDIQVLTEKVSVKDMNQLRSMMDFLKQKITSGVILLAAENNGKVLLISGVTSDLIKRNMHAGKLI